MKKLALALMLTAALLTTNGTLRAQNSYHVTWYSGWFWCWCNGALFCTWSEWVDSYGNWGYSDSCGNQDGNYDLDPGF